MRDTNLMRGKSYPYLVVISIGILVSFICSYLSLVIHPGISEIGINEFWIEEILPYVYWIGIIVITTSVLLMMRLLENTSYSSIFLLSCALLMISLRMVFPIISVSPILYEPDAHNYITVVSSWLNSGIDFGGEGNYQHDYPLAYVFAFFFTKLGISMDAFFRFAPLFIYAIDIILLYLLYNEITSGNKRTSCGAVFLFSLSSLGYWVSVHYCPDIIGTVFYLLSLYLSLRFAGKRGLKITTVIPVFISIFLLILSHHLGTLYLTLTLLGLSLLTGLNKSPEIKGQWLRFFILGVYTYSLWIAYGLFMYPSFFNIYVYLQFSGSPISLAQGATLLDNITFAVYPAFIFVLFAYSLLRVLKIEKWNLTSFFQGLRDIRTDVEGLGASPVYSIGYIFVAILFVIGFVVPNTFPLRVLEVLLIGMYPISSQTLLKVHSVNPSKKKKLLILLVYCIVISVMLTSFHRYYRQIQGRAAG